MTVTAEASPSQFTVKAVIPENQADQFVTYFDLLVTPGEKQVLEVIVKNSEDKDIVADIALNPAATARNGVVVYQGSEARDESLLVAVTDIAEVLTPALRVPAGGTATARIQMNIPDAGFTGVILGGIAVTADFAEAQARVEPEEGLQIENRYAYVIGVKLRTGAKELEPDFQLVQIRPDLINYRQALFVTLRQNKAVIADELSISAEVTKHGELDFLRSLELADVKMAPNSSGDFVIEWNGAMKPGSYRLLMCVERNGRKWEWDETFVIEGDETRSINNEAVAAISSPERGSAIILYAVIAVLALAVILLLILLLRKKKDTQPT